MMWVRRVSGLSRAATLLAASLGVAGVSLGAAGTDAPLADAVQRGDKATMLSLLAKQVDVNAAQGDGATALHWAVYVNDADTTAVLIRAGANVNALNNYGVTPLGLASKNGNAAIIEQLVKAGADPNDPLHAVNAGETPLMLAARSGQVEAVTVLLTVGANINANETWNGQSAPHVGGCRRARSRRRDAGRTGRRHPRALRQRCDAAPVCRAQGKHERRPRPARGRIRREREAT